MPPRADLPRSSTGAWLVLAGIALLTLVVIGGLMQLRFDTGETYPHYSTLRVDPLGTRALFEALSRTPSVSVERNFQRLDRLEGRPGTTLVLAGLDVRQFTSRDVVDADAVSRFVVSGGRLVIALNPDISMDRFSRAYRDAEEESEAEDKVRRAEARKESKAKAKGASPDEKPEPESKPKSEAKTKTAPPNDKAGSKDGKGKSRAVPTPENDPSFAETLKLVARSKEFFYSGKEGSPLALAEGVPLQPEQAPGWRSNVYLDSTPRQNWNEAWRSLSGDSDINKEPDAASAEATEPTPWKALATKGERVMIAERKLGSGTVVVCTDRYYLSNEALWSEPKPAFLAWLLGDADKIIFDETHLGEFIGDEEGIMTLAHRYRMHGLFLGGVLLFALFIWRSAFSLVPPAPEDDLGIWRADAVAGRSAASGLEGLLRRGITSNKLLQRCFEVWESTRAAIATVPADRRSQAKALLADPQALKKPVTTYRGLRDLLHTKGKR